MNTPLPEPAFKFAGHYDPRLDTKYYTDTQIRQYAAKETQRLTAALQERDAEIGLINSTLESRDRNIETLSEVSAAQRKVLEQALEAFTETISMYLEWHKDFPEHVGDKEEQVVQLALASITAIQEQLK